MFKREVHNDNWHILALDISFDYDNPLYEEDLVKIKVYFNWTRDPVIQFSDDFATRLFCHIQNVIDQNCPIEQDALI